MFLVLLRTTGAGFCYNIGRSAAAAGTVVFGLFSQVEDYRSALVGAGLLFVPATLLALWLPKLPEVEVRTSLEEVEVVPLAD